MRLTFTLAMFLFACAEEVPPIPPPPPPPVEDPLRFAELPCPPHTRAAIGASECAPVGPGPCSAPFESDGTEWGCRPIRAETCAEGSKPRLGATECRPVGRPACSDPSCIDAPLPDCSGASRMVRSTYACTPIGDCSRALPLDAIAVPADHPTIGAAIAAAADGAVIAIDAGTYAEAIVIDRPLTLVGLCAAQVIVEQSTEPVLRADAAASVSGITLRGGAIGAVASSALSLSEVVIEGTTYAGAVASGPGASIRIERSVIRAVRSDAEGARGRGASAEEGGSIALVEVEIADVREAGAAAVGAGSRLEIEDSAIFDVAPSGAGNGGPGVVAAFGGTASIAMTVIAATHGVLATGAGSAIDARDLWIRDLREGRGDAAVRADDQARFTGERIAIRDAIGAAIIADDPATEVSLLDSSIVDIHPESGGFAGGVFAAEEAIVRLERSLIRGAPIGAVSALGALIELRESSISGGPGSIGVFVQGGRAAISGSALLEHQLAGISVEERGSALIEESLIAGVAMPLGLNSTGVDVHGASTAQIERSAIFGFEGQGVMLLDASSATVTDSLIEAIAIGPEYAATGVGALDGSRLTLVRARVEDIAGLGVLSESGSLIVEESAILSAHEVAGLTPAGIAAAGTIVISDTALIGNTGVGVIVGPRGRLALERVLVADTRALADGRFGHAVVSETATVAISASALIGNASVAAFFDASRALVDTTLIARNGVGVHAQSGSSLLETTKREPLELEVLFTGAVVFFENQTRAGTGVLPLPDPFR